MRRRRASGRKAKARQATKAKRGTASKPARNRRVSALSKDTEVARLARELAEAREQQTATSEILGAVARSSTDVQVVLDAICTSAARLCEAYDSTIWRPDGDRLVPAAHHGPIAQVQSLPLVRGTIGGRTVLDKRTLHIADIYAQADVFPESRELARRLGFRTVLSVPLLREDVVIGTIALRRTEAQLFTERQVALLQTFADQAVIAIENARLLSELRESLQQQTATADVLKVISRSAFNLQPVFDTVVESVVRLCEAERAFLLQFDGELLRYAASYNVSPELREFVNRNPIAPGRDSISARAALGRRTVHVHDVQADPEYAYAARDERLIRTMLAVPMLKGDDLVGTVTIYRVEVNPFTDKQIALVETFAAQAVIAIENTRLLNELRQRTTDLSESLEQQTATSKVLEVISRSAFDLQAVFETVAESAVRLCGADRAFIFRFDGELLQMAAAFHTSQEFREFIAPNPAAADSDRRRP